MGFSSNISSDVTGGVIALTDNLVVFRPGGKSDISEDFGSGVNFGIGADAVRFGLSSIGKVGTGAPSSFLPSLPLI